MRVRVTLNKTNTGRIQLACVRSTKERGGIGTGFALPPFHPNALRELEDILRSLGVNEELITQKIALLRQVGPNDLARVYQPRSKNMLRSRYWCGCKGVWRV